jgi:hypothetical protein
MTRHCSISLNELIKEYLGYENKIKTEIQNSMHEDQYFWKKVYFNKI